MFFEQEAQKKKKRQFKDKRKPKRKKKTKFKKSYYLTQQDEPALKYVYLLQKIHTQIAQELFSDFSYSAKGDWIIRTEGISLFIDPVFGSQVEITGTSNLPLLKRLIIHIELLNLLKNKWSILKAVKYCIEKLTTQ